MSELFTHIAVCVDGSGASAGALSEAWKVHRAVGGARFSLVHVTTVPRAVHAGMWVADTVQERDGAREWLDGVATDHPGSVTVHLEGYPPAEVCGWATRAYVDLLVASSSRGLFDRVLLGSFAGYLSHHAPCSVLLTRPAVETNDATTTSANAATSG